MSSLARRRPGDRRPVIGLRATPAATESHFIIRIVGIYTSLAFGKRATSSASPDSRVTGDCYRQIRRRGVWATLKRELAWIHGTKTWDGDLLRSVLFDYVEGFYNPREPRNDWDTFPAEYEADQWLNQMCVARAGHTNPGGVKTLPDEVRVREELGLPRSVDGPTDGDLKTEMSVSSRSARLEAVPTPEAHTRGNGSLQGLRHLRRYRGPVPSRGSSSGSNGTGFRC